MGHDCLDCVVTAKEAAEMLGLTRQRVDQLCNDGSLRYRSAPGTRLIERGSVEAYQRERRPQGRPAKAK